MRILNASLVSLSLVGFAFTSGCGTKTKTESPDMAMPSCSASCSTCDAKNVCHDCTPGQPTCQGQYVIACNPDGSYGAQIKMCDVANNESCSAGSCLTPCDVAGATHSYIACDYWPVSTLTAQLNPAFDFAVAVALPAAQGDVVMGNPATVTVYSGKTVVATQMIQPGGVQTIILPWQSNLSQNYQVETSVMASQGAYHLVSTLPVTVYQFSPLEFEKPMSPTCMDQNVIVQDGMCHSYSNDASILLPSTALESEYYVIARQTYAITSPDPNTFKPVTNSTPGFFSVTATQDGTTVNITSTAFTEGGVNISPMKPGDTAMYMLDAGDTLEIVSKHAISPCVNHESDNNGETVYCDLGPQYDLTGSHITADKPIAVFGGHSCSFAPYNKYACDHLEQQMTPLNTWGKKLVVAQTNPQIMGEPNVFRVISGTAANMITFDPPETHAALSLDAGAYIEFIAQGGFQVSGTGHLAVGQYMVGASYIDPLGSPLGDPSLGLGVPIEQYRSDYDFYSPATYTKNYLTAIAPMGAVLTLDGMPLMDQYTAIGGSGYGYQYVELVAGGHHIDGGMAKFGINVSGIAQFTSYLYPGGQNLDDVPLQ